MKSTSGTHPTASSSVRENGACELPRSFRICFWPCKGPEMMHTQRRRVSRYEILMKTFVHECLTLPKQLRLYEIRAHTNDRSMHWGGDFLANALPPELVARLNEIDCDPYYDHSKDSGFVQCNGKTGEVIMVIPGTMPRRVSRRKLRALLATGIDIQV